MPGGARRALGRGFLRTTRLRGGSGACRMQARMGAGGVCTAQIGGGGDRGEPPGAGVTHSGGGTMLPRFGRRLWGFPGARELV